MPATDQLRLVDHHCHGVIDHQPDGEEFRVLATEADRLSDPGLETLDSPYGLALKKHVFPLFGLGLEATYGEFLTARARHDPRDLNRTMIAGANTSHLVVDAGLHRSALMSPAQMEDHTGIPSHEVVRLERVAEAVASGQHAQHVRVAVLRRDRRGLGWSSGIQVDHRLPLRPRRTDGSAAAPWPTSGQPLPKWQHSAEKREQRYRITSPVLMQHILWEAVRLRKPIQFHVGYGDSDESLYRRRSVTPDPLPGRRPWTAAPGLPCCTAIRSCARRPFSARSSRTCMPMSELSLIFSVQPRRPRRVTCSKIAPFNKVLYSSRRLRAARALSGERRQLASGTRRAARRVDRRRLGERRGSRADRRAHGQSRDPIVAASQLVCGLQTLVAREIDPMQPSVVSVGRIHGGTTRSTPSRTKFELGGMVRSYSAGLEVPAA